MLSFRAWALSGTHGVAAFTRFPFDNSTAFHEALVRSAPSEHEAAPHRKTRQRQQTRALCVRAQVLFLKTDGARFTGDMGVDNAGNVRWASVFVPLTEASDSSAGQLKHL